MNPQKLGQYQLLKKIATGGMAEIYLARQSAVKGFERLVVIKRILPHLVEDKNFVEMFLDEACIAAQLNHPKIVQIYDFGEENDQYYIAMEFLEGESLDSLVAASHRRQKPMPAEIAAGIVAMVCDGLEYAHKFRDDSGRDVKLVHRDVTPQNIFVLYSGEIKLIDFGIAKAAIRLSKTQTGLKKGSLSYMAPEYCVGAPIDARSDLFSLGIVFWELLTHKRLFKKPTEAAIVHSVVYEECPSIGEIVPNIDPKLEDIVNKSLSKDPNDRFQTAEDMGKAVREYLRSTQKGADAHAIADYINDVFGDFKKTKQKLLKQVANNESESVTKPESTTDPQASTRVVSVDEKVISQYKKIQGKPRNAWIILLLICLLVGAATATAWINKDKIANLINPPAPPQPIKTAPAPELVKEKVQPKNYITNRNKEIHLSTDVFVPEQHRPRATTTEQKTRQKSAVK